jgi:hypothetical protein
MVALLILLGSLLFLVFVNTGKVYIRGLSGKTPESCPKVYLDKDLLEEDKASGKVKVGEYLDKYLA